MMDRSRASRDLLAELYNTANSSMTVFEWNGLDALAVKVTIQDMRFYCLFFTHRRSDMLVLYLPNCAMIQSR